MIVHTVYEVAVYTTQKLHYTVAHYKIKCDIYKYNR